MTSKKRSLALLLCLVMLLSLFPTAAFAAEVGETTNAPAGDDAPGVPNAESVGDGALDVPNAEPVEDDALDVPDTASPAGGGAEQSEAEEALAPDAPNNDDPVILSASEESQGDGVLDVPNDTPAPVRVVFVCEPAETVVTVYDPAQPDEDGEPGVIDPEEDGSWLLVPGTYLYDAECEGYEKVEKAEFEVFQDTTTVPVALIQSVAEIEANGEAELTFEESQNATTSNSSGWTALSIQNATTSQILARLEEIRGQIDGRYWNNNRRTFSACKSDIENGRYIDSTTTTACQCSRDAHDGPHYNSATACQSNVFNDSGGWAEQCQGFANYMLYALFGVVRNLDGVNYLQLYGSSASDVSELKPGDVVNQNGGSHWYMVWHVDGNTLYVADCNRGTGTSANCKIQFSAYHYSASTVLNRIKAGTDRLNRPKCNDTANGSTTPTAITFNTVCAKSGNANGSAVTSVAVDKAILFAAMTFGNDNKPDYFNLYLGTKQNQLNKLQISNNTFSDSMLATYYPNCTSWIDFNDPSDIASNPLVAGTTYYYQFEIVTRSGLSYRSEVKTFSTTGTAPTYTISYNANGGTGAPANQTKTHGVALTLSSTKPTRANASAGSYTVTLNANGGSVGTSSLTAARTTSYSFKNWNTAQNGSGTSYNSGASYTANAAVTLYAQWNSNTTTAAVTLPTPTRDGYSFQGWATSNSATSGTTGSYTPTGNVTLYATWKQNETQTPTDPPAADQPTLKLSSTRAKPGETVTLTVEIINNPGIMFLQLGLEYDKTRLDAPSFEEGESLSGWQFGTGASWGGTKDEKANGTILRISFPVKADAPEGDAFVRLTGVEAFNENEEEVVFALVGGAVNVSLRIPGDATGDGKVNGLDAIRIQKYLAGQNVSIDLSAADVTGDGKVNGLDYIRMMKYFAGQNVELK